MRAAGKPSSKDVRDLAFQSGLLELIDKAREDHPELAKMMKDAGAWIASEPTGVLYDGKRKRKTRGPQQALGPSVTA